MSSREALRYVDPRAPRGLLYRAYVSFIGTRLAMWLSPKIVWKLDPHLMRLTGGRVGMGLMLPTALLETRGARTGHLRRNGVIYFHDGERVTIIASKLGAPEHPSWFHNARANPDVQLGGQPFRVEVVDDQASRARLWELADRVFPPYATYREKAARVGRTIPILQLVPRYQRDDRPAPAHHHRPLTPAPAGHVVALVPIDRISSPRAARSRAARYPLWTSSARLGRRRSGSRFALAMRKRAGSPSVAVEPRPVR